MTKRIFSHKALFVILSIILFLVLMFVLYVACDNNRIVNTKYTYKSRKVPKSFDGYKISVVADFHNGKNYQKVIDSVRSAEPDLICIDGDLISMNSEDLSNAKKLVEGLTEIASTYYVYGNHEYYYASVQNKNTDAVMKELLKDTKVNFMNNRGATIKKGNELINIIGYADSYFEDSDGHFAQTTELFLKEMDKRIDKSILSVLLIHRPQYFDMYSKYNFDLVLSGHLHGGLINIKPIRDFILERKFGTDEYCKGEYSLNESTMIVSGGIAKTVKFNIPRLFNTPEIVTVTLERKSFGSD